jgi:hypothetical protein
MEVMLVLLVPAELSHILNLSKNCATVRFKTLSLASAWKRKHLLFWAKE